MDKQMPRKPTTSKLKRILQCKSNVAPLPSSDKDLGHTMGNAPPQHAGNIHSLASPTYSSFDMDYRTFEKIPPSESTQKTEISNTTRLTYACATKKSHSSTTRTTPTVVTGTTTPHGRRSTSLHYNNHPRWNQTDVDPSALSPPPIPSMTLKKNLSDGSFTLNNNNKNTPKTTTPTTKKDNGNKGRRRYSCSSTTQDQQRSQRSRMFQEAKKTPPPPSSTKSKTSTTAFNSVTPSCSVLFSKASPAANAALAASSSPSPLVQQSSRRQHPPATLSMEKSRSTPLRSQKVKTYNVSPTTPTVKSPITPQRSTSSSLSSSPNKRRSQRPDGTTLRTERDSERKRRQQELEDLISGRRGSTLKLSLTPKNTLLN